MEGVDPPHRSTRTVVLTCMSTLVFTNAEAGSARDEALRQVLAGLEQSAADGVEVRSPADDQGYAQAVASAVGRDVVVVGGDGSIHRFLQEAHGQDLLGQIGPVGVVPMGTGNDLARGARLLALRAGLTSRGWNLWMQVDGEVVLDGTEKVLMVTLAVGPSVGGGTPVAPDAQPGDGQAEVMIACGVSAGARFGFARGLRKGRHLDRGDVRTLRGRAGIVEAVEPDDAFRVNTDGDVDDERIGRRRWQVLDDGWALRSPVSARRA